MKPDGHALLVRAATLAGPWFFALVARVIAAGYFLCSPNRRESVRLYRLLSPHRPAPHHFWCAFRQYQNFTTIHFDRFLGRQGREADYTVEGGEGFRSLIAQSGAILLMSHLGNWEMAARLLMRERHGLRLLLYMGVKEKEGVERTQKEELRRAGVTIIGEDRTGGSPFAAVEGIRLLREGGIVSMTGDVVWRTEQRRVPVRVLGHVAYLPEAPFVFALVAGVPIFVFFAFRTGTNQYRFHCSEPISIAAASKAERQAAIAAAAQRYADLLESALRAHPLEWYHFTRFLHEPAHDTCKAP